LISFICGQIERSTITTDVFMWIKLTKNKGNNCCPPCIAF